MQALGSIEVVGLVAGVEAADVACKTADVNLIGYELARGGGYVEQAQPESGPDQKPDATPKNPAETTKAPRTSTTRRKQS